MAFGPTGRTTNACDLTDALDSSAQRTHVSAQSSAAGTRRTTELLLVTGGKSGVGTSVVAALMALTAADSGKRVLLVDACESGGTMHHLFAVKPKHSLWMLSHPRIAPADALVAIDDTLTLLPGGTSGAAIAPTSDDDRRAALTRLATVYASFDLVLFDGGSRLDTINAITELANPALLLVTSADALASAANYAVVKSVRARRPNTPISIVANRHRDALSANARDVLSDACEKAYGRSVAAAGAIPDDPYLQAAVGGGMTVRNALNGSPTADAMRGVLSFALPAWSAGLRADAVSTSSASPSFSPPSRPDAGVDHGFPS